MNNFKEYYEKNWQFDGLSAKCIYGVYTGNFQEYHYPHDPDDLTRCFQCLRLITKRTDLNLWKHMLKKVVIHYPKCIEWSKILDNFDNIYTEYFNEYDSKRMTKTFKLMQEVIK